MLMLVVAVVVVVVVVLVVLVAVVVVPLTTDKDFAGQLQVVASGCLVQSAPARVESSKLVFVLKLEWAQLEAQVCANKAREQGKHGFSFSKSLVAIVVVFPTRRS